MIIQHNNDVPVPLTRYMLVRVAGVLYANGTHATHLIMHPSVREEYRRMVTPETPRWAKDSDGITIYTIASRELDVYAIDGHEYPVVTNPKAPPNEVAFWRGGECVAIIKDVETYE